jgi:hypothetical protein
MPGPKVEVWRAAVTEAPLACDDRSILAVVSDDRTNVLVPVWPRSDVALVAARLMELAVGE